MDDGPDHRGGWGIDLLRTGEAFRFAPAGPDDLEALVALRIAAMRDSLQRIGRFDPLRARQRLVESYQPEHTRLILVRGELAGCVALGTGPDGDLWLEHFYLAPEFQNQGLGGAVLARLLAETDATSAGIRLSVLIESPASRIYQRFGFVETHRGAFDTYYHRPAALRPDPAPS